MEEKIEIISGRFPLEGLWQAGAGDRAVVITHPHPIYGGTMHNPVVEAIQMAYQQNGYATLRFNFRGVGGSQGSYDNGIGEQEDVRATVARVQDKGAKAVDLAGYSFGAWINAALVAAGDIAITSLLMVSPPVGFIEFKNISTLSCLKLVVTGSQDDIAPAGQIGDLLPIWNPNAQFDIIEGCDHFYAGYLNKLQAILVQYLKTTSPDPT